jgi:large subunit ribosomal protein L30
MANLIEVKQVRSTIGQAEKTRKVVAGLGLRGIGKVRMHKDNNCIRGMINKVKHLVCYRLISK